MTVLLASTVAPPFGTAQAQSPVVTGSKARGHPPRIAEPSTDQGSTAQCAGRQYLTGFFLRAGVDSDTIEPICVAAGSGTPVATSETVASANIDLQSAGMVRVTAGWHRNQAGQVVRVACPPTKPFVFALSADLKNKASDKPHQLTLSCDLTAQEPTDDLTDSLYIQNMMSQLNQHRALGGADIYFPSTCTPGQLATGVRHWHSEATSRLSTVDLICAPWQSGSSGLFKRPETGASEFPDLSVPVRVAQRRTDPRLNPADTYSTRARRDTNVTLNPQPLPPVPDNDRISSSDVVGARSTNAGIIIVSGHEGVSPTPRARVAEAYEESDFAAKGADLASEDPVTALLRDRQPTDVARRAFDVGLGAAEGQTEWGPGKERLANSFPPEGERAFRLAAEYSVDRNRNAARLAIGSPIVQADSELSAARDVNPDPRFWLGFDIATAIFGDPVLGAQGNTALGPGSLGVRTALSALGKAGFDAAFKLHLSRTYGE